MIAIVDMGSEELTQKESRLNMRLYEVRINHQVITTFKHKRHEGLSKCLHLAADAVERRFQMAQNKIILKDALKNVADCVKQLTNAQKRLNDIETKDMTDF